ncbi:alpha/beta fold hydrolase [Desulfuromonas carbonis]|uniref:alpha/beta fold hydrolase n=1 Tax=Desulfuromonas sp. DDH964 TaxID=1823759 RepID=UPI00078B6B77|nr:alpha/beta fold hydrolase [Desulfuromonas sp. DDH964]AMV72753.1 O-methylpimelyl-(acyl carrier protein) methylesterase [Desulfuromonas sp. DDH964]
MRRHLLADGRNLAWRQQGSGAPLVLLHGWSMSSAVFGEVLPLLGARRLALAPDLRGHGDSSPGPGYALDDFAADLEGWLLASGHRQIDLLGWSLGGQVAIRLARRRRIEVRALLLVATTPKFVAAGDWPHGLPAGQVRVMARDLVRAYAKTQGDFFQLQFAGEAIPRQRLREIVSFAVRGGKLAPVEVALAALETLKEGDLRPELTELPCPVLVQQGELDRITLPGAAAALAATSARGLLELLPERGHAPFLSAPQQSVETWEAFLS